MTVSGIILTGFKANFIDQEFATQEVNLKLESNKETIKSGIYGEIEAQKCFGRVKYRGVDLIAEFHAIQNLKEKTHAVVSIGMDLITKACKIKKETNFILNVSNLISI